MQVTGFAYVSVNGQLLRSEPGAKLKPGGLVASAHFANGAVVGFSDKPEASEVDFTLVHTTQDDLTALQAFREATVTFETDGGQAYVISAAATVEAIQLDSGAGKVAMRMQGKAAQKTS